MFIFHTNVEMDGNPKVAHKDGEQKHLVYFVVLFICLCDV